MMRNTKLYLITLGLILLSLSACKQNNTEKTAFADMQKLTDNYRKLQEAQKNFEAKQKDLKAKYDSIAASFQAKYRDFLSRAQKMSKARADKEYQQLALLQQQITLKQQQEAAALQQQADSVFKSMLDSLKTFIDKYGKDHGYTYIFGKQDLNGLLYGKPDKDITDDMLKALNGETKKQEKQSDKK